MLIEENNISIRNDDLMIQMGQVVHLFFSESNSYIYSKHIIYLMLSVKVRD